MNENFRRRKRWIEKGREKGRERETESEPHRKRDRQADRQTDRQRERPAIFGQTSKPRRSDAENRAIAHPRFRATNMLEKRGGFTARCKT